MTEKRHIDTDTIAAVATPAGQGGVGILRISGPDAHAIAAKLTADGLPPVRQATLRDFIDATGDFLDRGLILLFAEGASFTGEGVAELQAHGSPAVMDGLLQAAMVHGARMARAGEFTERSFVNGCMDLAQAEAVADLIASGSLAAAKAAARSLKGEFSAAIDDLAQQLLTLRVQIEAGIDFPEEDLSLEARQAQARHTQAAQSSIGALLKRAEAGVVLARGANVALVGAPNAGKSSLMNRLSGEETAIVTEIPGTTRDVLSVDLTLRGLPVRLVDTAGLRETRDPVEIEGVRRAQLQIDQADLVLHVVDLSEDTVPAPIESDNAPVLVVGNKSDLCESAPADAVSALTGDGIESLIDRLVDALGYQPEVSTFSARVRHVESLRACLHCVDEAAELLVAQDAPEVAAELLRKAHSHLGEIVGEVSADALLGEIFSTFCIGK